MVIEFNVFEYGIEQVMSHGGIEKWLLVNIMVLGLFSIQGKWISLSLAAQSTVLI